MLTEADLPALRVLAELWSRWVTTQKLLKREKDAKVLLSFLRTADKLETQMLRYLREFGMTASSRGNIVVAGSGDEGEGFLD